MKKKFTFLMAALMLLTIIGLPGKAVGQEKTDPTVLFHETFGNNSGSARPWDDSYSVKSGVSAVYSGITGYTISNAKQSKNTGGSILSGLIQTTTGTDAYIIIGPLNVESYTSLAVTYQWKAASIKGTYTTKLYYTTSSGGSYSEITGGTGTGATSFVERSYATLPPSCQTSTLYMKVVWNTSNAQAVIDEFELTGVASAPAYTISAQSNNNSYGTVSLSGTTITATPANGYQVSTSTPYSVSPANSATVSQSGNTFTVTPSANTTVTINFEAKPTHTATFSVNGTTTSNTFAEGANITFPSAPAAIQGKVFTGWVTTAIEGTTNTAPDFVNTATAIMGDSNITYYAVFATASGTAASLTKMTNGDTFVANDKVVIVASENVAMYQATYNNTYVDKYTFDNNVATVAADDKNWFTVSAGSTDNTWKLGDGTNGYVYNSSSNDLAISTNNSTDFTLAWNSTENKFTLKSDSRWLSYRTDIATNYFRMGGTGDTPNGTGYFDIYKYVAGNLTYSNYCTSFTVYTITAVSNNTDYGTVSLSGEVITGAPKSSYRYASPAYTVTDGTATVTQSGNDFTVTPASNCTVQINFEAIPTYTLSGAVSPAGAGTVTLSTSSGLLEDATATATAAANAGYKFINWSFAGTGASLSSTTTNPTTVTIGTADVTVTANFEEVKTYAIKYSVNGVTNTVYVEENAAIDLSDPSSALIPAGYVFKGWRESTLDPTNTDPDDYVTSATSTQNKTYYAVMAKLSHNDATWTLDYAIETALSSSTSWGGYGTAYNYTATDGGTWTVKAYKNSGMQINTGKDCSIKIPTCTGNIKSIAITCSAAKAVGFSTSDYSGSGTITYVVSGTDATSQTLDFTGKSKTDGYIVPKSGSTSITKIVVTYKVATYSDYRTSVAYVTMTEDLTITGDLTVNYTLTVPTGKTLTVNGTLTNNNPANLIIEDGGQLICNNSVAATVKKSITASTASKGEGWYTISSPVNNKTAEGKNYETVAGVTNLVVPAPGKYDLYRFNETKDDSDEGNKRWENYKVHKYDLEMGRGYIYRKDNTDALSFVGNTNVGDITYTLTYSDVPELAGFNLIGNPYPHSIAKGSGKAIYHTNLATNYYVLSNDDTWALCTDGDEIPAKQGILVKAVNEIDLTISDTPYAPAAPGKYKNDNIRFSVKNEQFEDVAYAWFDKGYGLNKIAHRNPDAPMLYIPQDGTNYATAIMSDDIKVFGLSFKAMTMGKYTLRTKANGDYTYLHVIDRLTGEDVDMLLDGEYSFVASPNDKENRFIVKLEYKPDYSEGNSDIFAYQSGSEILVSGEGELQVFDVTGRNVMTTNINGAEAINGLSNGVYVFRLVGNDIKTQKIVVR